MAPSVAQLSLYSTTEYEQKAPTGFPLSCPTLDLSATWDSSGRNILIYRPPDQTVSKIHQAGPPGTTPADPVVVTWKHDGHFLAVGWNDGFVRLMGLENNKAAHHLQVTGSPGAQITHIGWASTAIADGTASSLSKNLWDGLSEMKALEDIGQAVDLPRTVAVLEIDTALPKISPLPSSSAGAEADATVFTLRSGIDFLFQPPQQGGHDKIDVMVIGTSDGKLHLSIHDSFALGTFSCPKLGSSELSHLIYHASHPYLSTHCLVLSEASSDLREVHLVPMDLPFVSTSPINLSLLASKLTTLQNLLRYLKQAQLHMKVEWKNTRELPSRFLRSVEGDLAKRPSGPNKIVPALYHTAVTGHAYEPVREWLLESLTERGHKRWEKAVSTGLQALRSLVHENFLPVLDRCAIIFSRLRGFAQFYESRADLGFSVSEIDRVLDIVSCLSLAGHRVLGLVMDELEHFAAFSTWLRFQIDRLASPNSTSEELAEKEATMDNAKILRYIDTYLTSSPLDVFLDEIVKGDYSTDWEHIQDGPSLLDILDKQLKKRDEGKPFMKALPHIEFLVNYLSSRSSQILKSIAAANKRSVRFGDGMKISIGRPISKMDFRLGARDGKSGKMYAALASAGDKGKAHLFCYAINVVNGISNSSPLTSCCLDLGTRKLVDLKFLNDDTLLVACLEPDQSAVIISVTVAGDALPFRPCHPDGTPSGARASGEQFRALILPPDCSMLPLRMEAHDACDVRGHVPPRVCLLAGNRTTLQTFAIPE